MHKLALFFSLRQFVFKGGCDAFYVNPDDLLNSEHIMQLYFLAVMGKSKRGWLECQL